MKGMRFDRERLRPLESADREQLIEFIAILLDVMVDRPDMLEVALETIRSQSRSVRSASHDADSLVEASRQSTSPPLAGHASHPIRPELGALAAVDCAMVSRAMGPRTEPARRSRSRRHFGATASRRGAQSSERNQLPDNTIDRETTHHLT